MVIDNLVSATIVLADGSVKELSSNSNEDLFWAIRGGGSNFGVVTDFTFKAHDQPNKAVAGYLMFPVEKLEEIIKVTNDWLNDRELDEDALLSIVRVPPDLNVILFYLFIFFLFVVYNLNLNINSYILMIFF
jgi:FAD/FMN-containing dehydrogenase